MNNVRTYCAAVLSIALICIIGAQQLNAQPPDQVAQDRYRANFAGQGDGLLAMDDQRTVWAFYKLDGAAEPTYRVIAMTFPPRSRIKAIPEVGRNLPRVGRLIVNADESKRTLEVIVQDSRVSFVAAMNERRIRPTGRSVVVDADTFSSITMSQQELDMVLERVSKLDADMVRDHWATTLYATGAFRQRLGIAAGNDITCIAGGPGAVGSTMGRTGQRVTVEVDGDYYACCWNAGTDEEPDLRAMAQPQ